jgi:hypothetical protein
VLVDIFMNSGFKKEAALDQLPRLRAHKGFMNILDSDICSLNPERQRPNKFSKVVLPLGRISRGSEFRPTYCGSSI